MADFHFTFENIKKQYQKALDAGYVFLTCQEYVHQKYNLPPKAIVNRIDIDFSIKKARRLGQIYNELGIKGSFFIRLHAPEYNPFSFEAYKVVRFLVDSGHEIGYHAEVIDQAAIWNEDAEKCFLRDIKVFNAMYGVDVVGVASHGGMTGLNNLDFWKDRKASDFGLLYEAYDRDTFDLFHNSLYVSDSEWVRWKSYHNGELRDGDRRSFEEHLADEPSLIYLLIHSDTYFDQHFYE